MEVALKHKASFEEHFVVRQWVPIAIDMEFRAFVCDGKLTALTQYNHMVYFPRLVAMKQHLLHTIQTFFVKHLHPRIEKKYVAPNRHFCFCCFCCFC